MKQAGGVMLAFLGVVAIIGAVNGTWRNVWIAATQNGNAGRGAGGQQPAQPAQPGSADNFPGVRPPSGNGTLVRPGDIAA